MLNLLPKMLILLSQQLYLILSLKQSALKIILLPSNNRDLVLHIAEVKHLLFDFLLAGYQLLCLLIQFSLHFIQVSIKACYRLLEVKHLLVFRHHFSLVIGYIILQNGFV